MSEMLLCNNNMKQMRALKSKFDVAVITTFAVIMTLKNWSSINNLNNSEEATFKGTSNWILKYTLFKFRKTCELLNGFKDPRRSSIREMFVQLVHSLVPSRIVVTRMTVRLSDEVNKKWKPIGIPYFALHTTNILKATLLLYRPTVDDLISKTW